MNPTHFIDLVASWLNIFISFFFLDERRQCSEGYFLELEVLITLTKLFLCHCAGISPRPFQVLSLIQKWMILPHESSISIHVLILSLYPIFSPFSTGEQHSLYKTAREHLYVVTGKLSTLCEGNILTFYNVWHIMYCGFFFCFWAFFFVNLFSNVFLCLQTKEWNCSMWKKE